MKRINIFIIVVLIIITVFPLKGTTILIQEPEVVITKSPLIIEAQVKDIKFKPISNLSTGEALVTLSVIQKIIGDCPAEIVIHRLLVTPDLRFINTEWLPPYSVNERFIICLMPTKNGYSTMGLYNGKFVIDKGFIQGTGISVSEFINQIKAIRSGQSLKFSDEIPRQTTTNVKKNLNKIGREVVTADAGSHLNGEFVTFNFTWDPSYLPIQMHYNPANAPSNAPNPNTIAGLAYQAYSLWSDPYSFLTFQNASPFTTDDSRTG